MSPTSSTGTDEIYGPLYVIRLRTVYGIPHFFMGQDRRVYLGEAAPLMTYGSRGAAQRSLARLKSYHDTDDTADIEEISVRFNEAH